MKSSSLSGTLITSGSAAGGSNNNKRKHDVVPLQIQRYFVQKSKAINDSYNDMKAIIESNLTRGEQEILILKRKNKVWMVNRFSEDVDF